MSASNYVHLEDCQVIRVTEKAIQVEWDGDAYWFPISQVADGEDYEAGDGPVTISVTEWIANEKGIEVDE